MWCRLLFSAILIMVSPHIAVVQQDQKTCQVIVIQEFISSIILFHIYSCAVIEHIDHKPSQFYILCLPFPIAGCDFCMCSQLLFCQALFLDYFCCFFMWCMRL
jgi:hypothetical protein